MVGRRARQHELARWRSPPGRARGAPVIDRGHLRSCRSACQHWRPRLRALSQRSPRRAPARSTDTSSTRPPASRSPRPRCPADRRAAPHAARGAARQGSRHRDAGPGRWCRLDRRQQRCAGGVRRHRAVTHGVRGGLAARPQQRRPRAVGVAYQHPEIAIPLDPVLRGLDGPTTIDRNQAAALVDGLPGNDRRPVGLHVHCMTVNHEVGLRQNAWPDRALARSFPMRERTCRLDFACRCCC